MPKTVIEIRGGVLEAVYSDIVDIDIILVDWDNIKEREAGVEDVPVTRLKDMPEDTRRILEKDG